MIPEATITAERNTTMTDDAEKYIQMALNLAKRGIGSVEPNRGTNRAQSASKSERDGLRGLCVHKVFSRKGFRTLLLPRIHDN